MADVIGGGFWIAINVISIGVGVLLWIGATRMAALQSYNLSMAAAILAMIPCVSPCCLIGLPFGIWAIVILVKPEVKAAFTS